MEFGSQFVYFGDVSDEEYEEDELDKIVQSDAFRLNTDSGRERGGIVADGNPFSAVHRVSVDYEPPAPPPVTGTANTRKRLRADPNIVRIRVGDNLVLTNLTNQPVQRCKNHSQTQPCTAVMSAISQVTNNVDGNQGWTCEFCGEYSPLQNTRVPEHPDETYQIKAPPSDANTMDSDLNDDSLLVFVMDTSGSMSTTHLITQPTARGQRRVYISRLDALRSAVLSEIKQMVSKTPKIRVALIAFSDKIQLIGDGTIDIKTILASDPEMRSQDKLRDWASQQLTPGHVENTYVRLQEALRDMQEDGLTALGPALQTGIALAGRKKGSKVIVCTDGVANRGFGTLNSSYHLNEQQLAEVNKVYSDMGKEARNNGVTVSVMGMEGEDCKLVFLSQVSRQTGGDVEVINPEMIDNDLANVVTKRVLATNVSVKVRLHSSLCFSKDKVSEKTFDLGNVDVDTVVSFSFAKRPAEEQAAVAMETAADEAGTENERSTQMYELPEELPFQTEISFDAKNGGSYIRVISTQQKTTRDRTIAEQAANMDVVTAFATIQMSEALLDGNVEQAEQVAGSTLGLVFRGVQHDGPGTLHADGPSANQIRDFSKDVLTVYNSIRELTAEDEDDMIESDGYSGYSSYRSGGGYLVADSAPMRGRLVADSAPRFGGLVADSAPMRGGLVADCAPMRGGLVADGMGSAPRGNIVADSVSNSMPMSRGSRNNRAGTRRSSQQQTGQLQQANKMSDKMAQKLFSLRKK